MTPTATSNEDDVRQLIERWAAAVHVGNLDIVLERHAAGIVMFDVPPPEDSVRGLDAYRATWPGFFDWQRKAPPSRSHRSRSPRAPTLRSPSRCFAAVLLTSSLIDRIGGSV